MTYFCSDAKVRTGRSAKDRLDTSCLCSCSLSKLSSSAGSSHTYLCLRPPISASEVLCFACYRIFFFFFFFFSVNSLYHHTNGCHAVEIHVNWLDFEGRKVKVEVTVRSYISMSYCCSRRYTHQRCVEISSQYTV